MTVGASYAPQIYMGDGTTTAFPAPWPCTAPADLVVTTTVAATGVKTVLALNSGYTVSGTTDTQTGNLDSATVTFVTAPSAGVLVTIERATPATQPTSFPNAGPLPSGALEAALDRVSLVVQQALASIAQALRFPTSDPALAALPPAALRALGYLMFDVGGNPVIGAGLSNVPVSLAMQPVVTAATTGSARKLLGAPTGVYSVQDPAYGAAPGNSAAANTAAIQAAINAAGAAGGGIVYVPPGTYLVSASSAAVQNTSTYAALVVPSNVRLVGAGMGISIIKASNVCAVIAVYSGIYSSVECLTVVGTSPGTGNVRLADGIFVYPYATYCKIIECEVCFAQDVGVELQGSYNEIVGCYIHDNYSNGVYVCGGVGYLTEYNTIHHNRVQNNGTSPLQWDNIDIDVGASYCIVSDNVVVGNDITVFDDGSRGNAASYGNEVINNYILNSPNNGISCSGVQVGFRICGNYITGLNDSHSLGYGFGIWVQTVTPSGAHVANANFTISGNQIDGAYRAGIYIQGDPSAPPTTFSLIGNSVINPSQVGSGQYSGIQLTQAAADYLMSNNFVSDGVPNMKYGMDVATSGVNARLIANSVDVGVSGRINLPGSLPSGMVVSNNPAYNPTGPIGPPSVPASGATLVNPYPYPCLVTVYGGSGVVIFVAGGSTGLTGGAVLVGAGQSIKLTYTTAPAWGWFGQ
jgi:hypothetical protein